MEITTPNNVNYAPKTLTEALQIILLQQAKIETIEQFMKDSKKAGLLVHGCFVRRISLSFQEEIFQALTL